MTFGFIQFRESYVRANDISAKWRSTERRFVKITFGYTTIRENNVGLNNESEKCRSALWSFGNSTIRSNYVGCCFFSARRRFDKMSFRQNNYSVKQCFAKIMWPRTFVRKMHFIFSKKFFGKNITKFTKFKITIFYFFENLFFLYHRIRIWGKNVRQICDCGSKMEVAK